MEAQDLDPQFYPIIESGKYIHRDRLIGISSVPSSLIIGAENGGLDNVNPADGLLQYQEGLNYTMAPLVNSIGKPSSAQMKLGSNSSDSSVSFGNCTNTASNSVIMGTDGLLTVNQTSNLPPSVLVKNFESTNNFLQYSSNVISLSCKSGTGIQSIALPSNTIFIPLSVVIIALQEGSGDVSINGAIVQLVDVPLHYCYVANIPTTVMESINIVSEINVKVVVNGNLLQLD